MESFQLYNNSHFTLDIREVYYFIIDMQYFRKTETNTPTNTAANEYANEYAKQYSDQRMQQNLHESILFLHMNPINTVQQHHVKLIGVLSK